MTYDPRTKIATAEGGVRIIYGPYVLNASKVIFNEKPAFKANGSVELREPNGNVMTAATMSCVTDSKPSPHM